LVCSANLPIFTYHLTLVTYHLKWGVLMKLTVLGCWAPYPRAGGACSGYLLQTAGKNILIECGNGVVSNLQKDIDFRQLDAVVVSHLHPDHYMDLYCLRHAVEGARRTDPGIKTLPLYLPGSPAEPFKQLSGYTEAFTVKNIEQLPSSPDGEINAQTVYQVNLDGLGLSFIKTDHPLLTYAVVVEGQSKFFYSADTKWCDYLPRFAKNADLTLCEASVMEEDKEYTSVGHLTARQAGELALQAEAGQLVITHFWPEYNLETLKSEAESGFGRQVTVAAEGLEIRIK